MQAYGLGIPTDSVQGIGNPKDSFPTSRWGLFWQDSCRVRSNLTFNYGLALRRRISAPAGSAERVGAGGLQPAGPAEGDSDGHQQLSAAGRHGVGPKGDGKTVIRASYGIFYDHPLLGLYFLGDASDGSKSGQLLFAGAAPCSRPDGTAVSA